jgi:phosphoribosylformimino-5-aminoimidazole carboxamide ribotide isomerase
VDLYPAVDIRGGRVTHVRSGNAAASVYGDDPARAIARLAAAGAGWVHLVDLDRAYGTGSNRDLVRTLLAERPQALRVQVGGSLRSEDTIREMMDWGADRVVIGCAAVAEHPALAARLVVDLGPERLAAAIDAAGGRVTPRGKPLETELQMDQLGARLHGAGFTRVVYTDVQRDGALSGPDIEGALLLAAFGLHVVASVGVGSLAHIESVRRAGLDGALVGRALHEGHFTVAEAMACADG